MSSRLRALQVYKSNAFLRARYGWTTLQHRIILLMAGRIDAEAEAFTDQEVPVAELVERAGLSSQAYYTKVREAALGLLDTKILVPSRSGKGVKGYNVLSSIEVEGGRVLARFNEEMRPHLLQLKSDFTRYEVDTALKFESQYAIRLYEHVVRWSDTGFYVVAVQELKRMLMLEDQYGRFSDFKRRVLEQAAREINGKTDYLVSYDVKRKGRTPHMLEFYIRQKVGVDVEAKRSPGKRLPGVRSKTTAGGSPTAGPRPEHVAFDRWWEKRSDDEQSLLESEALSTLDEGTRALIETMPESIMAATTMREALMSLWATNTRRAA